MDRRIKYTKQIIKETFINLLSKKDIKKITVSEICKIADINRATFYRYYYDVYDLLDKIEAEFVLELKTASNKHENYTIASFSKILLEVFLKNKDLVKIIFNNKNSSSFLNEILEISYNKCRLQWKEDNPNIEEENMEYASVFIFNGALGVINYWIQNDFNKDIDEIANIIEYLSSFGTKKFIYKQ